MPDPGFAEVVSVLNAILRVLETHQPHDKPRNPLKSADRARLGELLPAVHAAWGGSAWAVADLWDAPIPTGRDALRLALGENTPNANMVLGRLFARAVDRDVDGFVVRRSVRTRDGQTWACESKVLTVTMK